MANNLTPKEEFLLNPVTEHNITDAAIATFETNFRHPVKVEIPFKPVQKGTGDPSPDNVRPISGWNATTINHTGANLLNGTTAANILKTGKPSQVSLGEDTDGKYVWLKVMSGVDVNLTKTLKFKENTRYTIILTGKNESSGYSSTHIRFVYSDGNSTEVYWSNSTEITTIAVTSTANKTVKAITTLTRNYNTRIYYEKPFGIFEGVVPASSFEEYQGQSILVSFTDPSTGDPMTVYGGTVTLNEDGSADLVQTMWANTYDGVNLKCNQSYLDNKYIRAGVVYANPTGASWHKDELMCDRLKQGGNSLPFYGASDAGSKYFVFTIALRSDAPEVTTGAQAIAYVNNWLSQNPVTIAYQLASPRTYHFPNVGQLKAFLGTNNIWSDIGNVNVKYLTQNSETGMEYRGDRALELRRRAMIADAPTIHTTTGSEETGGLASFKSYVKAPVKKIEIPFKPKQDLHGYDHPWPAGGWKNLFNKDGAFVNHVVIKSETAYKLASGTGSAISTVTPGTSVLLNETVNGVTKLKPWIYLGLDESGNARLYREKADDEPKSMSINAASGRCDYIDSNIDLYLTDETTGFLSRFDTATLNALAATSIKYIDYVSIGTNTGTITTISRKCFLPSYSEMGFGDDPVGNEGQSYLSVLKTYYENNSDNTVRACKTEERISVMVWLRSEFDNGTATTRYRGLSNNGGITFTPASNLLYVRPMISLDPNTLVETVTFGKDTMIQNTTLYTDPITVSPSTAYTLSGRCYSNQVIRVDEYDANDNFLRSTVSTAMNHPSISFTTTENTAYVLVNLDWVIQFVQLEAGSAATSYAPYCNICPIEGYSNGISYFESKKANIYGARWDRLQHRLTRYGAAKDFDTDVTNFRINGEVSSSYDNPFDDLYPWSERKLCNINLTQYMALQNGSSITDCVTHWEGETGFSYDDPDGVWVYTPKFWGRSYDDANGHRCFEVADRPVHDFIEYDEQITARWRGVVEERTINGESKQVLLPTLGNPGRYTPVNTLHTYAKNYGGSVTSIYSIDPSYLLMIVEFASMNPRLDVGGGVNSLYRQSPTDKIAENATDSTAIKLPNSYAAGMIPDALIDIGTANGGNQIGSRWIISAELDENTNLWTVTLNEPITVTTANFWSIHGMANRPDAAIGSKSGYLGENNRSHAYYRGEELWGNMYMYVIGAYKSARDEVWLCPKNLDPDDYSALNENVHVNTGVQLATASGWNCEFGYPEKSHGLSAPALNVFTGGNATDPIGSYFYTAARGARILLVGGANYGTYVGFSWVWTDTSSYSLWSYGASPRLKNPPKGA